ncbi:MAG: hypothetical protein HY059_19490 [Proteobacteria bacterium]|nr:hypothetical protein [Pseudomonadota bacterium]
MRIKALALVLLLVAGPAAAQSPPAPDVLAREAIEKMIMALQGVIAGLPQYAAPEIDADGNITIRRLNPPRNSGQVPPANDSGVTL